MDQALVLLEQSAGSAKILAGGQSLNPTLNMRLSTPDLLIDINDLDDLKGIELAEGMLRVGAPDPARGNRAIRTGCHTTLPC